MTTNYGKSFFSEKAAQAFAKDLEKNDCEDIQIWMGTDGFGQTQYTVKWNKWD